VTSILVDTRADKKADGFILGVPLTQSVRVSVLQRRDAGALPKDDEVQLAALKRLTQAVQTKAFSIGVANGKILADLSDDLRVYIKLQAAIQAKARTPVFLAPPEMWADEEVQAEAIDNRVLPPGGHPVAELCRQLGNLIETGRLVLWWSAKERMLQSGLYFKSIRDAIFADFALRVALPGGRASCERCGNEFTQKRVAQKFCSPRCSACARKRRERSKRKFHRASN
jgi:hypothetical protein